LEVLCSPGILASAAGDKVRIGETGNLAVLKKKEWNLLGDLIHSGQLAKI